MKMPFTAVQSHFKTMAMSSPSLLAVAASAFALVSASTVQASPSVIGATIVMPDDGWYQVQDASTYAQICSGVLSCEVPAGTYIVINHTTGERRENIMVGAAVDPVDPINPSQTPLRELIPDREIVFGQSIDDIPSPIQGDNTDLVWNYNLVGDQLSNDVYAAPLSHQLAWESYSSLIPLQYRESLTQIAFFSDSHFFCQFALAGLESTGFSSTTPSEAENRLIFCEDIVRLNFDASMPESLPEGSTPASPEYFERLWIHETGQILEASYTVHITVPNANFYDTRLFGSEFPVGRQLAKDNYVGEYFRQFWLGEIADYYKSVVQQDSVATRMYAEFPTAFISSHAATNFAEDFSETFEYFVSNAEMPVDNGELQLRFQKVLYMWSVPELVQMRDDIRARSER